MRTGAPTAALVALMLGFGVVASGWAHPITELLEAEPPPSREAPSERWRDPHETTYRPAKLPADDAPLDELLAYWRNVMHRSRDTKPTSAVCRRLIQHGEEDPDTLAVMLEVLPPTPEIVASMKHVFDRVLEKMTPREREQHPRDGSTAKIIDDWLARHDGLDVDVLERRAPQVQETEYGVQHDEYVRSLTHLAPARVTPVLEQLEKRGKVYTVGLALELQVQAARLRVPAAAATSDAVRTRAKAYVEDVSHPLRPRQAVLRELMATAWPGRDTWLLSLFNREPMPGRKRRWEDESLFAEVVHAAPNIWIPRVAGLVGGKNRAAHDAAVACLSTFELEKSRADALRPLLPRVLCAR